MWRLFSLWCILQLIHYFRKPLRSDLLLLFTSLPDYNMTVFFLLLKYIVNFINNYKLTSLFRIILWGLQCVTVSVYLRFLQNNHDTNINKDFYNYSFILSWETCKISCHQPCVQTINAEFIFYHTFICRESLYIFHNF